jgi:hypothetical protein
MTRMAARSGVVTVALVAVLAACGSRGARAATTPTTRPVHLARRIVRVATDEVDPTDNQGIARNGVDGVDLRTGAVRFLGSTGHGAGEGEGVAFAQAGPTRRRAPHRHRGCEDRARVRGPREDRPMTAPGMPA